jgi:hypothetical protein
MALPVDFQASLAARFANIKASENLTYAEVSPLSRELLVFVSDGGTIDVINQFMAVLRPVLKREAVKYFAHFLPHTFDKKTKQFGKKFKKQEKVAAKKRDMEVFLEDETNDLYTYAKFLKDEKQAEEKDDSVYLGMVEGAAKVCTGKNIEPSEIIEALCKGGITIAELTAYLAAKPVAVEPVVEAVVEPIVKAVA